MSEELHAVGVSHRQPMDACRPEFTSKVFLKWVGNNNMDIILLEVASQCKMLSLKASMENS
jgi:hypothetical protein